MIEIASTGKVVKTPSTRMITTIIVIKEIAVFGQISSTYPVSRKNSC